MQQNHIPQIRFYIVILLNACKAKSILLHKCLVLYLWYEICKNSLSICAMHLGSQFYLEMPYFTPNIFSHYYAWTQRLVMNSNEWHEIVQGCEFTCSDRTASVDPCDAGTGMFRGRGYTIVTDAQLLTTLSPFYKHALTVIPAWISNQMPSKVWNDIIHPFPNFNGYTVEVWGWISNFTPHITMDVITYPCWNRIKPC